MIKGLEDISCNERVQKVYLPSLSKRTSKGDSITSSEKIQ